MDISVINSLLDQIINDRTVPRNIRNALTKAKEDLNNPQFDEPMRINSAISIIDEVANDPNLPMYTRTQMLNIASMLETMNEQIKKQQKVV